MIEEIEQILDELRKTMISESDELKKLYDSNHDVEFLAINFDYEYMKVRDSIKKVRDSIKRE